MSDQAVPMSRVIQVETSEVGTVTMFRLDCGHSFYRVPGLTPKVGDDILCGICNPRWGKANEAPKQEQRV